MAYTIKLNLPNPVGPPKTHLQCVIFWLTGYYFHYHPQVLERYGKELCIVVTNLNQMSVEYFHPKTTPNTPVKRAVRMSIALPGKELQLSKY